MSHNQPEAAAGEVARASHPGLTHRDVIDPCTDPRWNEFNEGRRAALFTSARWLRCLSEQYGFTFEAQVLEDTTGRLMAALPYALIDDLRGERIVSLPFSDVADPMVDDEVGWRLLTAPLLQLEIPVQLRTFAHPQACADRRFETTIGAVWHEVDTQRHPDEIFAATHQRTRAAVRKAERAGFVAAASTDRADLEQFFRLHLDVRRHRHRLLAQPIGLFEQLWERYVAVGDGAIIVARRDGRIHGATFLIAEGDTVYYKFSATSVEGRDGYASHLCAWHAIRYACGHGARALDLGRSDVDQPGLVRFKARLDAVSREVATHSAGRPPAAGADAGAMLGHVTELLVDDRVPDDVTARAGDLLYRYFA